MKSAMTRSTVRLAAAAVAALSLALIAGCPMAGTNGANNNRNQSAANTGATGGNAEVVSQVFAESLGVDLSELPDDTTDESSTKPIGTSQLVEGPNANNSNTNSSGNPFAGVRRSLVAATGIINGFHHSADRALALARKITRDMTDRNQTQVEGEFLIGAQRVAYKADFGAFDLNGDGTPDGSGTAFQTPVVVRVWTDQGTGFARFLCALVATKPSNGNVGAGQLWVHPSTARPDAFDDLQIYIAWDRTDTTHEWNEAFVSGQVTRAYALDIGHQRVDLRPSAAGTPTKTVRSTSNITQSVAGFAQYQLATHYERGQPNVLVSALSTGGSVQVALTNVCVNLAQQALAAAGACDGFDLQDFAFLPFPTGEENNFPAAFAETPSF